MSDDADLDAGAGSSTGEDADEADSDLPLGEMGSDAAPVTEFASRSEAKFV